MKKIFLCVLLLFAIFAYSNCKKQVEKKDAFTVAVSVFPLYDIVKNISGDTAEVVFVIPAGADPHTFEPRPSIANDLARANLFIGVTKEFDGWIEKYLPAGAARKYVIGQVVGRDEKRKISSSDDLNPHIWLSVKQAKKLAEGDARFLSDADPVRRPVYEANLASYLKKLDELDREIARMFADKKNRSFVQWHEAWNYFAADYGLAIAGTVQREGSDKASVRSIKQIVDRARTDKVTVIVVSLSAEAAAARVLAKEISGTIVPLDGIGTPDEKDRSDYLRLMRYNAKMLSDAMR